VSAHVPWKHSLLDCFFKEHEEEMENDNTISRRLQAGVGRKVSCICNSNMKEDKDDATPEENVIAHIWLRRLGVIFKVSTLSQVPPKIP